MSSDLEYIFGTVHMLSLNTHSNPELTGKAWGLFRAASFLVFIRPIYNHQGLHYKKVLVKCEHSAHYIVSYSNVKNTRTELASCHVGFQA